MIRWGGERAHAGPWRAEGSIALLVPVPDGRARSADFARRCLAVLAAQGYRRVVTGALGPEEQLGFLEAGFEVYEELHLLVLDDFADLPSAPEGPRLHRAGRTRKAGILDVDARAFSPFWRLDRAGLKDALGATPRRRLRVVLGDRRRVTGYAICGASGQRGFVQRLAVLPEAQGFGLGRRLLLDGLSWLRRSGVGQVSVNTQQGNLAALSLYRRVGFRDDPAGLRVLTADLSAAKAVDEVIEG